MAEEQQKTIFRITHPPGGACSDIFGSTPTTTPPGTPRKVRNHMASNIFTPADMGQGASKTRQRLGENDSFDRLFGGYGDSNGTTNGHENGSGSISSGASSSGSVTPNGSINGDAKLRTPRKVKNHMASNIFTPDMAGGQGASKTRQRLGENDSFDRLFGGYGDSADGAVTPRGKNQPKGNIGGIPNADARANGHGTNGHANGHSNGTTNGHENGSGSISSGASSSGSVTPDGSIHGDAKSNGSEGGIPLAPSRRIPPGGYSSKLW